MATGLFLSWYFNIGASVIADAEPKHDHIQLSLGDSLIAFAKTLEGLPYRPGGCTIEKGFDCSGLVMFTYGEFNINVGRSSRDQALAGHSIPSDRAKPGDIIVFARGPEGKIFHAGLVQSNSRDSLVMLHANKRNGVHTTNITASSYWGPKVAGIRRVERAPRP